MQRYKLIIEYKGTDFFGWQRQEEGLRTVQQVLEEAAFEFCRIKVPFYASGRTDKGVHAKGQVAHVDFPKEYPEFRVRDALNAYLRVSGVAVLSVEKVSPDFHARFDCCERAYLYRIINRRAPLTLDADHAWWVVPSLDLKAMKAGAEYLQGEHDFTSFRATKCQSKSPVKRVDEITLTQNGEEILLFVRAPSFLHHQIRNFAGALKLVGEGKWTPEQIQTALERKERAAAGPTAPPQGLSFLWARYPEVSS